MTICTHENSEPRLLCRTCKKLICDDCIIEREHADHELDKIQHAAAEFERQLSEDLAYVRDSEIPAIEEKIQVCEQYKSMYLERTDRLSELVDNNFTSSVEVLRTEKDRALSEIKRLKDVSIAEYERKEAELTSCLLEMREFETAADVDEQKSSDKMHQVQTPKKCDIQIPSLALPTLLCEPLQTSMAKKVIGTLKTTHIVSSRKSSVFESPLPSSSLSEEINIVARDRYLTTGITAICPVGDNSAWVTRADKVGSLDLVSFEGSRIKVEKTIEIDSNRIDDLAMNGSGDLLIVGRENPFIRILRHGRKGITTFSDVSPYIPFGLCVTKSDHVLVCAAKASDEGKFLGTILDLNEAGKLARHIDIKEVNGDNVQLNLPRKVQETSDGRIVILECVELTEPKIFIASANGELQRVINGKEENFACIGICCDLLDRLVIADRKNNAFILVDSTQNASLERHDVDKMYDPWCVAPSADGKIWIGCGNSYVMIVEIRSQLEEEAVYSNVFV